MAVPKLKHIVEQVFREGDYNLTTEDGCAEYTRQCSLRLHDEDNRFRMLRKPASRTHAVDEKGRKHGVDAVAFLDKGKAISIDIVGNSATPEAEPAWTVDKVKGVEKWRYKESDTFVPDYDEIVNAPPPEPVPPPASNLESRVSALEQWARSFGK